MAKRRTSRYRPGARTRDWIKTVLRSRTDAVIGGWQPGTGRRSGTIGSLLLGAYDVAGRLRYIGQVGTGMTAAELHLLHRPLTPLARADPPFDEPMPREFARCTRWVAPVLVGEVEFRTWTLGPTPRLRHPSWRGLREVDPRSARIQPPGASSGISAPVRDLIEEVQCVGLWCTRSRPRGQSRGQSANRFRISATSSSVSPYRSQRTWPSRRSRRRIASANSSSVSAGSARCASSRSCSRL